MGKSRGSQSVAGGVLVLTLAGIIVKAIGLFYKIPLTYVLGDEGMGYFNAAYTIYAWLYMLSTAGLPIAVSILISEARARGHAATVKRVIRVTACVLLALGALTTTAMVIFARQISVILGAPDARYTVLAIAPTLFFVCITSLFRGCFQGFQNMVPTAVSQLAEALGKVGVGLLLATYAARRGFSLPVVSAFAVLGVTVGTIIGTLYLGIRFVMARARNEFSIEGDENRDAVERVRVGQRLFAIALPITVSASVMSLTGLIDLGMMIRRLTTIGFSAAEATALYGNYTTLVVPMFNLPTVVVYPIATGIIPALSTGFACEDRYGCKKIIGEAFRYAALIAVPAAIGLAVFARPILALLYPAASVDSAYRLLTAISPAVYLICILTVSNAILQACGASRKPMISMLAGGCVKIGLGYFLLGLPNVGILGAPVGTGACYAVALLLNLVFIATRVGYLPPPSLLLWRPLISAVTAVGAAGCLYYYLLAEHAAKLGTLIAIGAAIPLYGVLSVGIGAIEKNDISRFLHKKYPLGSHR